MTSTLVPVKLKEEKSNNERIYVRGDLSSFTAANLRLLENRSNPWGELSEKSFNSRQKWLSSFPMPLISAETLHSISGLFNFKTKGEMLEDVRCENIFESQ